MKWTALGLGGCLVAAALAAAQDESGKAQPARPQARNASNQADEKAIRDVLAAFARSYNAGDAKALAALFDQDAQVELEDGTILEGRDAIERQFAAILGEGPRGTIELTTDSLTFLGTDAALEEGTSTVKYAEGGETPEIGRYTVLYVKRDGKWLHHRVRELPVERTPYDHLKELEWMVGEWVTENSDSIVHTTCKWTDNKCYLLREFTVQIAGQPAMTGTQRIGWDPRAKQIRSWVFDSEGGFAEGLWAREGNQWIVKSSGVLRDGRTVTATQIVTYRNQDASTWASTDRTIGGEVVPDIDAFVLVRKPPQPRAAGSAPAKTSATKGAGR
jgi:uncharacterized protein (TIGR02246 family)